MPKAEYLTKSRFKLSRECPTKLYYTNKTEYANQKHEDRFLLALAEGGFQVGELAKHYFPGGHEIESLDHEQAERQTTVLLDRESISVYEAAIRYQNLFVRTDILIKEGSHIQLIEVKAKSFDTHKDSPFLSRSGNLVSEWRPYLEDVAFQKYVLMKAYPKFRISCYLMLADKSSVCKTDGLNQKFQIQCDENSRKGIKVSSSLSEDDLRDEILVKVPVDQYVDMIHEEFFDLPCPGSSFSDYIQWCSLLLTDNVRHPPSLGSHCAKCEFRCSNDDLEAGLKNGFQECWTEALGWKSIDFEEPSVLDLWNFRKKDACIAAGKTKLVQLSEEDVEPKENEKPGLSPSQRQWLQIEKARDGDCSAYFDADGMRAEMATWRYPLHFIDFETSMVAIPFTRGMRPYEGIAFQFSHHVVNENGGIRHAGEYLNLEPGAFPNFDFVRALERELGGDSGTVFRYASHENTFLNMIHEQLGNSCCEESDRDELRSFIQTITKSVKSSKEKWEGARNMVDMCELVKRYHYDPATEGSNSIKYVLPAILNSSTSLQEKYSKPIYGAADGIPSKNFTDWIWIQFDDGRVRDPYQLLRKLFPDASERDVKLFSENGDLRDGGAAMTAYGRMQFTEVTEYERGELELGLLRYCELDTFAMVLIFEAWDRMLHRS